jgi:two-component system, NtrC family, sensor kinase
MIGRRLPEVIPHLWPQVAPAYERVMETGEPVINVEVEGEGASSPGVRSWLASLYPACVGGEMIGIGQVVVDVTESRRAADLRAAVMQNMAEGLFVMDGEGRLVLMNAAPRRRSAGARTNSSASPCTPRSITCTRTDRRTRRRTASS